MALKFSVVHRLLHEEGQSRRAEVICGLAIC